MVEVEVIEYQGNGYGFVEKSNGAHAVNCVVFELQDYGGAPNVMMKMDATE